MSWKDMDIAIDSEIEGLTTPSKLLWVTLARYRNRKDGLCFPKLETLMRRTCQCRRAVQRNVRLLEELGVLSVIPGSGRTPSHYKLLICHSDDVSESDADESSGVSEPPQGRIKAASEAAEIPVRGGSDTPESGSFSSKRIREGNAATVQTGSGTDSTVSTVTASLPSPSETRQQQPQQQPPKIRENILPIPLDDVDPVIVEQAKSLRVLWMDYSKKPAFLQDFIYLLQLPDNCDMYSELNRVIPWMFTTSQWASESEAWKGSFDIRRSGDFVSNFRDIWYQWNSYYWKQCRKGEDFPWTKEEFYESLTVDSEPSDEAVAQPTQNREDVESFRDPSVNIALTNSDTRGTTSSEPEDAEEDEEAWRQEQMKLHTAPVPDDDYGDEAFSEEAPDVATQAEPEECWATRRKVDSPGSPYRKRGTIPCSPVTKMATPPPTKEAFYLTPQRCLSAWEKRHPGRPCDEADFDCLLDYYDEDDILFAIEHFTEYGYWSEEIRTSSEFSDKYAEIMDEVRPPDAPASDDEEL
jgi:hypothetical protein